MQDVVVVDYGAGNLRSATKALERAAHDADADARVRLASDAGTVADADRIVLPGVGAFADCWRGLTALDGMVEALTDAVWQRGVPFLGICVGMQLLATRGRENEVCPGLDWIPGEVVALAPDDPRLKVPHMGWNALSVSAPGHPVLAGIAAEAHAYFVHSYAFRPEDSGDVLAVTDYGGPVVAAVGRANIVGTQFHPEKSQATGLRLLRNFLTWTPGAVAAGAAASTHADTLR